MEVKDIWGNVLFALEGAKTICELITAAVQAKKSLNCASLVGANLDGARLDGARLVGASLVGASLDGASLDGARLDGAHLVGASLVGASLVCARLDGASLDCASLDCASLDGVSLDGASLDGARLDGASLDGKKVKKLRVYSGLYRYTVWIVLFDDGTRFIRMGCLWKSVEEWNKVGIRNSNTSQYPNDGSDVSEERVRAFEFAKDAVSRLK